MSFLDYIFAQVENAGDTIVLREPGDGVSARETSGRGLLHEIGKARSFLHAKNVQRGDRCALLAPNTTDWVAMNLAIIAEGLIVVPLYARQAPAELVAMMKD